MLHLLGAVGNANGELRITSPLERPSVFEVE